MHHSGRRNAKAQNWNLSGSWEEPNHHLVFPIAPAVKSTTNFAPLMGKSRLLPCYKDIRMAKVWQQTPFSAQAWWASSSCAAAFIGSPVAVFA